MQVPRAKPRPVGTPPGPTPPPQHTPSGATFAEALRSAAASVDRDARDVSRIVRSAQNGRVFSSEELLAVQVLVYRHTQQLELASRLVDKGTSAVRSTLQSQQ